MQGQIQNFKSSRLPIAVEVRRNYGNYGLQQSANKSGGNMDRSPSAISTAEQNYGIYSLCVIRLSAGLTTSTVSHR